ncbi:MAG TPA: hypothetical protein VEA69_12180 [Tepidisphaeraceae bacterium]|nr:hypothetical protein [Tepidisphaeraceae bacterium]
MSSKLGRRVAILLSAVIGIPAFAAPPSAPGVVSHVKVLSDKVEDVSSLEAWRKHFIKEGMTDREKAMVVWENVYRFRHQSNPPNEYLESMDNVHDPIKAWNVYGYGMCCCASANVQALSRYVGLESRGWGIINHSVPEVKWGGAWHMLDSSLITYFPKADGDVASVDEISKGIAEWLEKNPALKGNDAALRQFMRQQGWKKGPEVLARCPSYDWNGWFPAATHGWYATMGEYAEPKKLFVYEYGTALGYQVNVQLRKGERLTRNWSNKGLHVNENPNFELLKTVVGKGDLRYTPKHGDLAPGRIGNGTLEWNVPVTSPELANAAISFANLRAGADGLVVVDGTKPGEVVLRVPTSYVFLGGQADVGVADASGGGVKVELSDNNGLDWKPVTTLTSAGVFPVDLKPLIKRKYDYRLKLTLDGGATRVGALRLTHDVQHSQRVLPALTEGKNTITFEAGPQEGTITVQGTTNPKNKEKNVFYKEFRPVVNNLKDELAFLKGGNGDVTWPVATPGDITRVRIGAHYRARDVKDVFDVQVSFDAGKSWKDVGKLDGPTAGHSKYFVFTDVPAGARGARVRMTGTQRNTLGFHDVRIDADYAEPHGGFAPVKVTYVWEEAGAEKRDERVVRQPRESYTIECAGKPLMKSIAVERAD